MALGIIGGVIGSALGAAAKAASSASKKKSSSSKSKPAMSNTDLITGNMSYDQASKAFGNKYAKEIAGIADYNDADLSTGRLMFEANLNNNAGTYGGGGKAENWDEMLADWNTLKGLASTSSKSRGGGGTSTYGGASTYGGYNVPSFQLPDRPELRSANSMADLLGIIYDHGQIKREMTDAVEKQYANLDSEFRRSQDIFYDTVANNADLLTGTLRRGDRDAVMAGTTRGTQAANELSAMLGTSQQASQGATELVQARDDLVRQREEALAKVKVDAMKYYNDLGINLGQLSASELNALTTAYASEVATLGGVYNTDVLAGVERDRMASSEKIAGMQGLSNKEIAELTARSNENIANITGDYNKQIEAMRAAANASLARNTGSRYSNYNNTSGLSDDQKLGALYSRMTQLEGSDGAVATKDLPVYKQVLEQIETLTGTYMGSDKIIIPEAPPMPSKPFPYMGLPLQAPTIINNGGGPLRQNSVPIVPWYEKPVAETIKDAVKDGTLKEWLRQPVIPQKKK